MENLKANVLLDAKGLACPMPIVKTKKIISEIESGEHELLKHAEEDDVLKFRIKKG